MDLVDIQIVSSDGSRYVMVVHEYFTGWKYLFAPKAKDPVLVAQCLAEVIRDHDVCEELLSDFGARGEFVNEANAAPSDKVWHAQAAHYTLPPSDRRSS
jgi:hypothetical protein